METRELYKTASLARLSLDEGEASRLSEEVGRLLEHVSRMQEVDIEGQEPTTHALSQEPLLRNDEVHGENRTDSLLHNAPELEDRFIVIPNVL
jgi:aspartyl-tRNA(Asn)/glutamyl-tRNA(Gln) amidotransferase subunit C